MAASGTGMYSVSSLMDVAPESRSLAHTPGVWARQLPFYLIGCGHFFANEGYYTERTGLPNYLLLYTAGGTGFVRTKDAEAVLSEGSLAVINCVHYQYYRTLGPEVWNFKWFHFDGASADLYCKIFNGDSLAVAYAGADSPVSGWLDRLYDEGESAAADADIGIVETITRILTEAIRLRQSSISAERYARCSGDISQAIDAIREGFSGKLSIGDLSERAHMSKYHFLRVFKECTGQTPYEFLLLHRIGEARRLLQKSDMPVSEIAGLCGFSDTSNFIRCFRRTCGTTPGAFRKDRIFTA